MGLATSLQDVLYRLAANTALHRVALGHIGQSDLPCAHSTMAEWLPMHEL